MTSNLGADILVASDTADEGKVGDLTKVAVLDIVRRHFAPEFINRIDEMIVFNRLSRMALRDIVDIRLREVQQRLENRHVTVDVDEHAKAWDHEIARIRVVKISSGEEDLIVEKNHEVLETAKK
ncbi:19045_t:CDS:2, partial [Racocetra fulgida]